MASPTTIENLPDNVLSEVLVRLLAKEVGQMRCVSKPWNALLSHPSFITSHLNHSLQNNDSILLFFGSRISFEFDPTSFTARASRSPHLQLPDFQNPVIPQSEFGCGNVIGSMNGLICIFYLSSSSSRSHKIAVHIWNPSRSALLTLPPFLLRARRLKFGFGFDPKTNDYKVLKLTNLQEPPNMEPQCEVYSMKKGSWKSISQRFPSHLIIVENRDQVCVNDHLHWLSHTEKEGMGKPVRIVAFDLCAEEFIEIPVPEAILDRYWFVRKTVLGVLGGKLCAMSSNLGDDWELWVTEEYGVAESWVKHHAFPPFSGDVIPYGFTSKGEFVFKVDQEGDRFGLYDLVAAKTKTFRMASGYCSISSFVEYVDSLVWIKPPKPEISNCGISQLC